MNNAIQKGYHKKLDGQTDNQQWVERQGIGSEMMCAKLLNVYPDLTVRTGGVMPKEDFYTPQGCSVDVKCTHHSDGRLLAQRFKIKNPCDLYVLMIGEFPTFEFAGACTKEELFLPENLINLGRGEAYGLGQRGLFSIEKFKELYC